MSALFVQLAGATRPASTGWELNFWGWLTMLLSVGFVTGLLAWCSYRVLRESRPQKVHPPAEVDTRDTGD